MIITTIQQAKKHEDRVNVFVDGEFAFALNKNLLIELGLYKGQTISETDLQKFKTRAKDAKLHERIYNYLSLRPRSLKEMRDYLLFKVKLDPEETAGLLTNLQTKNLVNDESFASWWIENRLQSKRYSFRQISAELSKKGVSQEIIREAIAAVPPSIRYEKEQVNLTELLDKYLRKQHHLEPRQLRQKALQYLLGKGYNYEDVQNLLKSRLAVYNQDTENPS